MDSIDHRAELFVREMLRASTVEDGKARASRLLENFKKSIWELSTARINEVVYLVIISVAVKFRENYNLSFVAWPFHIILSINYLCLNLTT